MLANDIIPVLKSQGHELILTDINPRLSGTIPTDITDAAQIRAHLKESHPDYCFHLTAETNVDLCEQKPEHAFRINRQGTRNIVMACKQTSVKLLYISTGGVFYGDKKEPYTEADEANPKNVYGQSKLDGERIVQQELKEYFILRAGWMVGGWEIDKKFVFKIVQQLREGKSKLRVVADKFGTPTFTIDFANNLMNVINSNRYGLYHMGNKGNCSRYDIAVKIVEYMGLTGKVEVEAISSDEYPLPAPRADSEMMHNAKLEALGMNNMPRWEDSLKHYIQSNSSKQFVTA